MAAPEIDFGLVGEGERAFPQIIGRDIDSSSIPGLIW
jgi:radical SAM superfamily enzyme YgiQ (UPF0313 family)